MTKSRDYIKRISTSPMSVLISGFNWACVCWYEFKWSASFDDPECENCGLHISLSSKSYQSKDDEKKLLYVEGIRFYFYCTQYRCVMLAQ